VAYVALYRAYRPQTFKEVAGQKPIIQTLKNAIKLNKVAHAYLFAGPRGTGKTTMAKIMAKALNCQHGPTDDPCNECEICQGITKGTISDVIEIDAASNNGVDEIRELRDNVKYLPSQCRYKVYIIDEVHMLSQGAFNALLKTLEEPPAHVVFILATTEPNKIPLTILSRCQRFDFQAISESDMVERLKKVCLDEKLNVSDEALHLVASLSEGGMRDALSLLDQSISFSSDDLISTDDILAVSGNVSDKLILDLLRKIKDGEASNALDVLNKVLDSGKEISKVISDITFFLRNVLLFKINKIESTKEIYKDSDYITFANSIDNSLIYKYLDILNDTLNNIKYTNQKRAFLEISIIKMSDHDKISDISSLMRRIEQLERKVERLAMFKSQNEPIYDNHDINLPNYDEIDRTNITFDNSKCIEVSVINDIINNGDKQIRTNVINKLPGLIDLNPLLSDVKCVCTSKDSAIFTLESEGMSNRMMKDPAYSQILDYFKEEFNFNNIYFINQSMWDELLGDWMNKYKDGIKSPILDNHDIRILKYVKQNNDNNTSKDSIDELFDEDLIKEE